MSTRPFLTSLEKKWLVYLIIKALGTTHQNSTVHGDVKPENIMVSSWNWVVLTDFALFKPIYLPDDDTSDYNYYFTATRRGSCCIAPERFISQEERSEMELREEREGTLNPKKLIESSQSGIFLDDSLSSRPTSIPHHPTNSKVTFKSNLESVDESSTTSSKVSTESPSTSTPRMDRRGTFMKSASMFARGFQEGEGVAPTKQLGSLTTSMDIFSLGCVIGELYLNGDVLFSLPDILLLKQSIRDMLKKNSTTPSNTNEGREEETDSQSNLPNPPTPILTHNSQHEIIIAPKLARIRDEVVRGLVAEMTNPSPLKRKTISEYRSALNASDWFAPSFGFLYSLFHEIHNRAMTADERVILFCIKYERIMKEVCGVEDDPHVDFFSNCFSPLTGRYNKNSEGQKLGKRGLLGKAVEWDRDVKRRDFISCPPDKCVSGQFTFNGDITNLREETQKIVQSVENMISASQSTLNGDDGEKKKEEDGMGGPPPPLPPPPHQSNFTPLQVSEEHQESIVLLLQLLCSSIRHVRHPHTKQIGLLIILRLTSLLTSPNHILIKLDRIVPLILSMLEEEVPSIRASIVHLLRLVLSSFDLSSPIPLTHSELMMKIVAPALTPIAKDQEEIVRLAFAESLGTFAEVSRTFLEKSCLMRQQRTFAPSSSSSSSSALTNEKEDEEKASTPSSSESKTPTSSSGKKKQDSQAESPWLSFNYDLHLNQLHDQVSRWLRDLLSSEDGFGNNGNNKKSHRSFHQTSSMSLIKRAILMDLRKLCLFFGPQQTIDLLLTQILTFLNDRNWELRKAFCVALPTLSPLLPPNIIITCLLPCVENALVDVEEEVVQSAVTCLRKLGQVGGFSNNVWINRILKPTLPLLLHPCLAIREAMLRLLHECSSHFSEVDQTVVILPLIAPYLSTTPTVSTHVVTALLNSPLLGVVPLTYDQFKTCIRNPTPRMAYKMAVDILSGNPEPGAKNETNRLGAQSSFTSTSSSHEFGKSNSKESSDEHNEVDLAKILDSAGMNESDLGIAQDPPQSSPPPENMTTSPIISIEDEWDIIQRRLVAAEAIDYQSSWYNLVTMKPYLTSLSREMRSKANFWNRPPVHFEDFSEGKQGRPLREVNPMRIVSSGISSNTAQSVLIPNHKSNIEAFIPDEFWALTSPDSTTRVIQTVDDMNLELMNVIFGVRSHVEAERARMRTVLNDDIFGGDEAGELEYKESEEEKRRGDGSMMMLAGGVSPGLHTVSSSSGGLEDREPNQRTQSLDIVRPLSSLPTLPIHTVTDLFCSQGRGYLKQITALDIPRLPPALGPLIQPDGSYFSLYKERLNTDTSLDGGRKGDWKPRVNVPVFSTSEHSQPVNRLSVAQDHVFFTSCSDDRTVKVIFSFVVHYFYYFLSFFLLDLAIIKAFEKIFVAILFDLFNAQVKIER